VRISQLLARKKRHALHCIYSFIKEKGMVIEQPYFVPEPLLLAHETPILTFVQPKIAVFCQKMTRAGVVFDLPSPVVSVALLALSAVSQSLLSPL
jgi:hypothetical protein